MREDELYEPKQFDAMQKHTYVHTSCDWLHSIKIHKVPCNILKDAIS